MRTLIVALAVLLGTQNVTYAQRSQECIMTEEAIKKFETQKAYSIWTGLSVDGTLMTLWGTEDGKWALTYSIPQGVTCILDKGTDGQLKEKEELKGDGI